MADYVVLCTRRYGRESRLLTAGDPVPREFSDRICEQWRTQGFVALATEAAEAPPDPDPGDKPPHRPHDDD